jgi:hypothetical protein
MNATESLKHSQPLDEQLPNTLIYSECKSTIVILSEPFTIVCLFPLRFGMKC